MKKIFCISLTMFLFASCSSTRVIPGDNYEKSISRINYLGSSYESEVYLSDSSLFYTSYLHISNDSLVCRELENDSSHQIAVSRLSRIVIKDKRAAFMGGLFTGLGSSALVVLIGKAIGCKTCHPDLGPVYGGALAAVVGFIYGYYEMGEKEFIFSKE